MMLVRGFPWVYWFRLLVRVRSIGQRLWRSLVVESVLLSLGVDGGLFKLALWRSVLVDGRVFDGVGWCSWSHCRLLVIWWILTLR